MRVVIALGGNALLRRDDPVSGDVQRANLLRATAAVAEIARDHEVVITHGNGPQVGILSMRSVLQGHELPDTFDVLGAETAGLIGCLLQQELTNRLPGRIVVTVLTQVEVGGEDPAFDHPSKPIGPTYPEHEARRLQAHLGWTVASDGEGYRRVIASPAPSRIVELSAVERLVTSGVVVICAGGGGIPVVRLPGGELVGVEAIIDKDLTAALLARQLRADALLILTDVDAVFAGWGTPDERPLERVTPEELRTYDFANGSMGPKVAGAIDFVEATGGFAGIGALGAAESLLRQESGTIVVPR